MSALTRASTGILASGSVEQTPAGGHLVNKQKGPSEDERNHVLWVGRPVPRRFTGELMNRGFDVLTITLDADAVSAAAPTARALVLEVSEEVTDAGLWAGAILDTALAHGLAVGFVLPTLTDDDIVHERRMQDALYSATSSVVSTHVGRVRAFFWDWVRLAEWIMDKHRPGPGASSTLRLEGLVPTDPVVETLLRRAFHDLIGVRLEALPGGKSGAGVWIARPSVADHARRTPPFLVKWNTLQKTREEQSCYSLYAQNAVSFRLRPPLHPSRCVESATHGLLVFDFIERAIPFRSALRAYPAGQLVGSLFDHTLSGCLGCASDTRAPLAAPFERIKVLHWSDGLRVAAAVARERNEDLPDVDELRNQLTMLPPVQYRMATSHGDLHSGNLLVAAGSSDVLLIDFGSIAYGMPVVTDPACLEVSITFAPADAAPELGRSTSPAADAEWLRAAYQFPLEPFTVPRRDDHEGWLADAVRAVRSAARQHEASPVPYAIAVASYLVRYASYDDNGSIEDRSLAYELACGLVHKVDSSLKDRSLPSGEQRSHEVSDLGATHLFETEAGV